MCDNIRTNVLGYHVNDIERCTKFIEDKNYLIISNDKYWLGKGMYFWDNNANANYWMNEKKRKEPNNEYIKVNANIYTDEDILLDLSNREIVELIDDIWAEYCKKNNEKLQQPLGVKIDKILKFFEEEFTNIKVIKGIGDYKGSKIDYKYCGPKINFNHKVIYCIRNHDIAVNRKVVGS